MEFQSDEYARKEAAASTPWGFWPTIGFSVITVIGSYLAALLVAALVLFPAAHNIPPYDFKHYIQGSMGLFLSIVAFAAAPLMIGMALLFAKLKKGISVKEYIALREINAKSLPKWLFGIALIGMASDIVSKFMGRPIVPKVIADAYQTAGYVPLLWLAFIIAAPLSEEIVFRGFLFKGIQSSRMGATGAIILTSFAWTALHAEYDMAGLIFIFIAGIYLGFARYKTKSIYAPVVIHSFINLVATCEAAILRNSS